jgi:phage recombination protein Bet
MSTETKPRQQAAAPKADNGAMVLNEGQANRAIEYVPLGAGDPIKLSVAILRLVLNPRTRSGRQAPDEQMMKFMMLCKARRLDPFEGDAFMIGYESGQADQPDQWSLITSIYAFLKRAEVNPEYEGIESGVIVKTANGDIEEHIGDFLVDDETLLGGWAKVHRSDRRYPNHKRVEFKRYSTTKNRWKDDPGGMIVKVAECQALRDTFPTTLGGLFVSEEMSGSRSIEPTQINVLPTKGGTLKPQAKSVEAEQPPATAPDGEILPDAPPAAETPTEQAPADTQPPFSAGPSGLEKLHIEVTEHFERIGTSIATQRQMMGCTNVGELTEAKAKKLIGILAKISDAGE